ncbi:ABC transporter ATP-binding protein [Nocardioides insulae]|uniref:ABC transporter ATP-binding protein n=1 Tax=Nocardioides insulae TaxID=394734 RepID=UPI000491FEC1|nr:ABC transporter ATP-binding protein [Nocardioides insulae]
MNSTTGPDRAPAIELHGLVKRFRTPHGPPVRAVDGIDLSIGRGEIVAFLGPNGAGKTTTLDMVLGLTAPSEGSVRVHGLPPREAVRTGRVSAVLQTGGLLRDLTVRETVRLIASTFPTGAPVDEVLERTGLTGLAGRRVSKCSGGEQQRLRFALALLPDPDLLILDEPTAGMDVTARRDFWATMHEEAGRGRTVVFATHYLEEADRFARRIVMVAGGRLVADGPTDQIRSRVSGRTVRARLSPGGDRLVGELRDHPACLRVEVDGDRVEVQTTDSDAVARMLLLGHAASDLEITSGSLDHAFTALTQEVSR